MEDNIQDNKTEELSNKQVDTSENKLNELDMFIMECKFLGFSYPVIYQKAKEKGYEINESSVNWAFSNRLKEPYKKYSDEKLEALKEMGISVARDNVMDMFKVLVQIANSGDKGDAPRVAAANSIIDRIFGKSTIISENKHKFEDAEELEKARLELKKALEQDERTQPIQN